MKLLCFIRQIAFFSCFFSIFSIQVIWLAVLTITLQQEFPLVIVIYPEIFATVHSVVKILKYIEGLHLRTNSIKNVLLINYFLFYHLHNWYLLNSKNMSLAVLFKAECKRRFVWLRSHNWMYETMTKFRLRLACGPEQSCMVAGQISRMGLHSSCPTEGCHVLWTHNTYFVVTGLSQCSTVRSRSWIVIPTPIAPFQKIRCSQGIG